MDEDKNKKAVTGKSSNKNKRRGKNKVQSDPNQNVFTQVDIRVGQIVKVWEHEGSDKLFCEEIDIGEEKPDKLLVACVNITI